MRVKQKKSPKKVIAIVSVIVLLLAGGVFAYFTLISPDKSKTDSPDDSKKNSQTTDEKNGSDTNQTNDKDTTKPKDEDENENKTPVQYEGDNPNSSNTLTGIINYKAVVDGNLTLRNTINQMLSSGTCTLTLTSNGRTVTRTANIIQNPSSSSCEGFSIPVTELGSGTWNINLAVNSGDRTGLFKDSISI